MSDTRSIIVNHLQSLFKDANVSVACIYCNYKEQDVHTASNLVASLLRQMVQNSRAISDNVRSFYKYHQNRDTRPTLDEFTHALQSEIRPYTKIFVVVDALDECSEGNDTRANILKALRSLGRTVNLVVTSRDLPSIASEFQDAKCLSIYAHNDDMRRYIEGRIARTPRRHLKTLQETIVSKIIENVKGM